MDVLKITITQNVDGLHVAAGSQRLVEIHGNRNKLRCIACGLRLERKAYPPERLIRGLGVPECPECGGLVKGDGVMFGEPIPRRWANEALRNVGECDCMLLVGTSGTVYPAAAFPQEVRNNGGALIEINPLPTPFTQICDVALAESAAKALPELVDRVERRIQK
jgi:NAD-dependent deacetylase